MPLLLKQNVPRHILELDATPSSSKNHGNLSVSPLGVATHYGAMSACDADSGATLASVATNHGNFVVSPSDAATNPGATSAFIATHLTFSPLDAVKNSGATSASVATNHGNFAGFTPDAATNPGAAPTSIAISPFDAATNLGTHHANLAVSLYAATNFAHLTEAMHPP